MLWSPVNKSHEVTAKSQWPHFIFLNFFFYLWWLTNVKPNIGLDFLLLILSPLCLLEVPTSYKIQSHWPQHTWVVKDGGCVGYLVSKLHVVHCPYLPATNVWVEILFTLNAMIMPLRFRHLININVLHFTENCQHCWKIENLPFGYNLFQCNFCVAPELNLKFKYCFNN